MIEARTLISAITQTPLRLWARTGRAIGYHYMAVEQLAPKHSRIVRTRLPNGCVMECDLAEHVERQIYFQGVYEPIESQFFVSLIEPGTVVIDAGANVGQYSLLASTAAGKSGQIHSFEPAPRNYERLGRHVATNSLENVTTNQMALWHRRETLNFGQPDGNHGNSGSYRVQASGISVSALPLDEYARDLPSVDLIKMDVEGSEPFVLQGGLETLERFHPTILMEINRSALISAGSSPEALWQLLQSLGYRATHLAMNPEARTPITSFENIAQINIVAHVSDIPKGCLEKSTIHDALRWARSRW